MFDPKDLLDNRLLAFYTKCLLKLIGIFNPVL